MVEVVRKDMRREGEVLSMGGGKPFGGQPSHSVINTALHGFGCEESSDEHPVSLNGFSHTLRVNINCL